MKLRTGDVVRHNETGAEHRVLDVGAEAVVVTWNNAYATCGADSLTLLRRPVQVGDVLRWKDYETVNPICQRWIFERVEGARVLGRYSDSAQLITFCVARKLAVLAEHADGAPIEPPAIEPAKAGGTNGDISWSETTPTVAGTGFVRVPLTTVKGSGVLVAPEMPHVWGLDTDAIARGLFATDPDVLAVVLPQADATLVPVRGESTSLRYEGSPMHVEWKVEKADPARVKAALDRAWRRDELGRATHWRKRVAEALEKIGGGS